MNKIEALELELAARKMVEGTNLEWISVIRSTNGNAMRIDLNAHYPRRDYELALGIVEGTPAWVGDTLYWMDHTNGVILVHGHDVSHKCWSWTHPKTKTITIELRTEDAKQFIEQNGRCTGLVGRVVAACRKTLEEHNND